MHSKRMAILIIIVGIIVSFFSLAADYFGIGNNGIQAAQIMGVEAGIILVVLGWVLLISIGTTPDPFSFVYSKIKVFYKNHWLLIAAIIGFLIAFVWLYVIPIFFNENMHYQYFYRYLPDDAGVGRDLRTILAYLKDWFVSGLSPYRDDNIYYPPLYNLFFAPIFLLGFPRAYYLITYTSIACYIFVAFLLPLRQSHNGNTILISIIFMTGIISYGFMFELERGQFNLIAFAFCLLAIYLYHYHNQYRIIAYILFSIAVQLKIYPLIFVVMLVKDWRDWKNNLLHLVGLGLFNIALLFSMGYSIFVEFIAAVGRQLSIQSSWIGNHSIKAFVYNLSLTGLGVIPETNLAWLRENASFLEKILLFYFAFCFVSIVSAAYIRREKGYNHILLLVCTIGSMIIPSISHDYKLALLAGPLAICVSNLKQARSIWNRLLIGSLVLLTTFSYAVTLFPSKYRPEYFGSCTPLLILMLTAITLAYHFSETHSDFQTQIFS